MTQELVRQAFLDFMSIVTALFEEVWPDAWTTEKVLNPEALPLLDDGHTGCHVQFYVALGADGLEKVQMVAHYLISHQWSCFVTESADTFLSRQSTPSGID